MKKMDSEFISGINVFLDIKGKLRLPCQLKRHLSPRTVGLIVRSLPLYGNVHHLGKSIVYFETKIHSGIERKKTDFKKGDIAYLPAGGSICIFLSDMLNTKPMTPVGKLMTNIERLNEVKSGDILTLYLETA